MPAPFHDLDESSSPTILGLSREARAVIEAAARARFPREACGLLLGRRRSATEVEHALEADNLAQDTGERFELDPAAHLAAEHRARALGLEVVGVWHSHPGRPARPSELDCATAWSGWSYVIVSVRAGAVVDLRSWRLAGTRFLEEPVRT